MSSLLKDNTTTIQEILEAVNALPEAGGSGGDTATVEQATPTISVSSSGLITASATQTAGYVSAGTKSATKQLTTQAAKTITPGTSDKTIPSGRYLTGTQTIKGDANLVAGNIKSGVSIFGVAGSYEASDGSSGGSDSDAEAMWLATIERGGTQITRLPDGVTKIGVSAFYNCTNLALTSIPDSVTAIHNDAFYGCTNLVLTSLPDRVRTIGADSFRGCTGLALTSIPDSVTNIARQAFYGCTGLTEITFRGETTMYENTFKNCTNLTTINVPWAEGEVANAPWGATNATINYNYTGG